ncbi:DUF3021 family protein [Sporosarcina oncorhynchi]|uniref:DUF3021 family protein n=1 Tax=Sporosarcina oncorhynchi TaxID=3056444 RepID=A0ABZ0L4J8_9BACL|nr:DUF3021 family protein [Sporosarcina sp. T2O-4]WOV86848.1 DUF3021 family protein [Sporosarcina sp. T2O-4]
MKNAFIYISAACFAFTASTIFYSLFRLLSFFPPLDEKMSMSLLLIAICITFLISLSHRLPIEQPFILHGVGALCVILVLLGAGVLFDLFPLVPFYVAMTVVTGLLSYAFVIVLSYMNNKADEQKINRTIKERRL